MTRLFDQQSFGSGGANFWIGQVVDDSTWRDNVNPKLHEDPADIKGWGYRYKVRIFGNQTKIKTDDEVPDELLATAEVLYPVTAGSGQAGSRQTPNLRHGNFVLGFYKDGLDSQQPVIMGAIGTNDNIVLEGADPEEGFMARTGTDGLSGPIPVAAKDQLLSSNGSDKPVREGTSVSIAAISDPMQAFAGNETTALKVADKNKENELDTVQIIIKNLLAVINRVRASSASFFGASTAPTRIIKSEINKVINLVASFIKSLIQKIRGTVITALNNAVKDFVYFLFPNQRPVLEEIQVQATDTIGCVFNKIIDGLITLVKGFLEEFIQNNVNAPLCAVEGAVGKLLNNGLVDVADALSSVLGPIQGVFAGIGGAANIGGGLSVGGIIDQIAAVLQFLSCDETQQHPKIKEWSPWAGIKGTTPLSSPLSNLIAGVNLGGAAPACNTGPSLAAPPALVAIGGNALIDAVFNPIVSASGEIIAVDIVNPGVGYQAAPTIVVTATNDRGVIGGGAVLQPVVQNGAVTDVVVKESGSGFLPASNGTTVGAGNVVFSTPGQTVVFSKPPGPRIPGGTTLNSSFSVPRGASIPSGTIIPSGTTLPTDLILSEGSGGTPVVLEGTAGLRLLAGGVGGDAVNLNGQPAFLGGSGTPISGGLSGIFNSLNGELVLDVEQDVTPPQTLDNIEESSAISEDVFSGGTELRAGSTGGTPVLVDSVPLTAGGVPVNAGGNGGELVTSGGSGGTPVTIGGVPVTDSNGVPVTSGATGGTPVIAGGTGGTPVIAGGTGGTNATAGATGGTAGATGGTAGATGGTNATTNITPINSSAGPLRVGASVSASTTLTTTRPRRTNAIRRRSTQNTITVGGTGGTRLTAGGTGGRPATINGSPLSVGGQGGTILTVGGPGGTPVTVGRLPVTLGAAGGTPINVGATGGTPVTADRQSVTVGATGGTPISSATRTNSRKNVAVPTIPTINPETGEFEVTDETPITVGGTGGLPLTVGSDGGDPVSINRSPITVGGSGGRVLSSGGATLAVARKEVFLTEGTTLTEDLVVSFDNTIPEGSIISSGTTIPFDIELTTILDLPKQLIDAIQAEPFSNSLEAGDVEGLLEFGYTAYSPNKTVRVKPGDQISAPFGTTSEIVDNLGNVIDTIIGKGQTVPITVKSFGNYTTPKPITETTDFSGLSITAGGSGGTPVTIGGVPLTDSNGVPVTVGGIGGVPLTDSNGVPVTVGGTGGAPVTDSNGVPVTVSGTGGTLVTDSNGVPVTVGGTGGTPVTTGGVPVTDSNGVPVTVGGSGGTPLTVESNKITIGEEPSDGLGRYPAVLAIKDVAVLNNGINYSDIDEIVVTPDNGAKLEPILDDFGKLIDVNVIDGGLGFKEMPKVIVKSKTGINAKIVPVFDVIRLGEDVEESLNVPAGTPTVKVIDCVGQVT